MNLPNSLTIARLILIPVFLLVASMKWLYADYIAAGIFIIAAVTDSLDGYLARKRKQITQLGKFLDPVADKILIMAALITLVEMGRLPGWIAILIIGREIAVTGLRAIAAAEGIIISSSQLGKAKTFTQIVAVVCLFLGDLPFVFTGIPFGSIILTVALIFTLWSGLDYFLRYRFPLKR